MNVRHVVGFVLIATPLLLALALFGPVGPGCPDVAMLRDYHPPEASRVFAADGSLIADLSPQRRIVVELDEVPALVRDGFVAVEDRRFWQHEGVDLRGVARALWRDLTSLSFREGFSTIPMQLARNVFPEQLPRAKKLRRKICEIRLASQIEEAFSKRDILELYLNQVYLGSGLYGVEAAAQGYFGKPVSRVNAAEAALLVGLVQSPEGYNPRRHPLAAVQRRNVVLDVMAREGVISAREAERAKARPLRLAPPIEAAGRAPYVVAAVRRELRERFGPDADIQGLRVYTGIDPELQRAARDALLRQIERIESGAYGRWRHARPENGKAAPDTAADYLQGMIIVLDPHTGEVRALVGGRDFALSQFDRAFQAHRQPGSAFKPIVYAAALRAGMPATTRIDTSPVIVDEADGGPAWSPGDHVPDSVETLSMRTALAKSSNNAAVRVGRWVGVEEVVDLARRLGIRSPIPPYPSIFLGSAEVVPAELVAAYAAFGNGGFGVEPTLIERVEDADGRVRWRAPDSRERVIDDGVAFLTLSLLQDVVDRGTGTAVRAAGFDLPAAGKTGTTNDGKDAWFIGMTPDLVAGVWLGFDRPVSILPGASGGSLAAPAWADFMLRVYATRPAPAAWTAPATLVRAEIDTVTGFLATGNCPPEATRLEYFLPGTEPLDYCTLHPETGIERLFDRLWRGVRSIF
ncbi:MAG TPA: PBP1A family penicillin-binding protein [Longimicrobiales bacterium]